MTKYASGEIALTEMIERANLNTPFFIFAATKADAHKKMREAHSVASRKKYKITTDIMCAFDVREYERATILVRIAVLTKN